MNTLNAEYIFFLKTNNELPRIYFHISKYFAHFGIDLVPVNPGDLINLIGSEKHPHVIGLSANLASRKKIEQYKRGFIGRTIRMKKIDFYDLSSFSMTSNDYAHLKNYHFFQMPLPIRDFTEMVSQNYFKTRYSQEKAWPGGRRPRWEIEG